MTAAGFPAGWVELGFIGRGQNGLVYRVSAAGQDGGPHFALKCPGRPGPQWRRRLGRELSFLRQLSHPAIPAIVDADVEAELPFFVSDLVDGPLLSEWLALGNSAPDLPTACAFGGALLDVLGHCHAAGVVHGDVKEANLVLRKGNLADPVLIDFDIAVRVGEENAFDVCAQPSFDLASAAIMILAVLVGSVRIPLTLWGAPPHRRAPIRQRLETIPLPGRAAAEGFFDRALSRDPARRFQTAAEMRQALHAIAPSEVRPPGPDRPPA